jgi:PadR family transcriptional regulator, regulatory protein PadR
MPGRQVAIVQNLALTAILYARLTGHVALPHQGYNDDVVVPQEEAWAKKSLAYFRHARCHGPAHLEANGVAACYGIARRIEQVNGHEVLLNQGTIYASLVRLQQRGWISAEWGTSNNNRTAKFYSITKRGRKQLTEDTVYWRRLSGVMGRVLAMEEEGGKQ